MRPVVARSGLAGVMRPEPGAARWSAVDLARRRSVDVARAEAEASEMRGDPLYVVRLWQQLAAELESVLRRHRDGDAT